MPHSLPWSNQDRPCVRHSVIHYAARVMQFVGGGTLGLLPILVLLPGFIVSHYDCTTLQYNQNPLYNQDAFLIALGVWLVLTVFNGIFLKKKGDAGRAFGLGLLCMLLLDFLITWQIFTAEFAACFKIRLY